MLKDFNFKPYDITVEKAYEIALQNRPDLKSMDLVVTVDTSVAHLAGAMGVKTYLMLPYVSDWRWFKDTKITPWYNSIEIFKQTDFSL